MARPLRILLVAVTLFAVSGIAPASAALVDDCGDECAGDEDCGDEGCGGEDQGCPPLCGSCVCGAWAPPLDVDVEPRTIAPVAIAIVSPAIERPLPDPPIRDVFHPPRASV